MSQPHGRTFTSKSSRSIPVTTQGRGQGVFGTQHGCWSQQGKNGSKSLTIFGPHFTSTILTTSIHCHVQLRLTSLFREPIRKVVLLRESPAAGRGGRARGDSAWAAQLTIVETVPAIAQRSLCGEGTNNLHLVRLRWLTKLPAAAFLARQCAPHCLATASVCVKKRGCGTPNGRGDPKFRSSQPQNSAVLW